MIAIVYPQFYGVGGIARYLDSFLGNLPTAADPIVLVTGEEHRVPRSYPSAEIIHVPFTSNRANLAIWSWRVRDCLRELHRARRIRKVNLHWPPLIPGLFVPREIPLILTAHTTYRGMSGEHYSQRYYDSQWNDASLAIKKSMERYILARASKVITLTEQGRSEVLSYGFSGPVSVIPNGADTQRFVPDPSAAKDIDVLFSGRIERRKGSRPMVQVCQALVAAKPDIRICIVGYGEDEAWVGEQLRPLAGSVHLAGKISFERMVDFYRRSRVYVSTSYYEGLPGTCLEAMAMALPAVVWDFLFYKNLVEEGSTGKLVPPNEVSAMSQVILKLLAEPATVCAMGSAARKLIESRYDWAKLVREVLNEFS